MKEKISIILGSKSDVKVLQAGFDILDELKIPYSLDILSAHRDPDKLIALLKTFPEKGIEVVIACAGLSAALPGFVAAFVNVPVIGVPLEGGMLDGLDSLLSIVQVPKGLGLVSTGPGKKGFINASIVALQILGLSDKETLKKVDEFKAILRK